MQENDYYRLQLLSLQMTSAVPHTLGLNPREHRQYKSYYSSTSISDDDNSFPIDMQLIKDFIGLPASKRRQIARRMGTHQRFIFKNMLELKFSTSFF
jgi:hypothetical protein